MGQRNRWKMVRNIHPLRNTSTRNEHIKTDTRFKSLYVDNPSILKSGSVPLKIYAKQSPNSSDLLEMTITQHLWYIQTLKREATEHKISVQQSSLPINRAHASFMLSSLVIFAPPAKHKRHPGLSLRQMHKKRLVTVTEQRFLTKNLCLRVL